MAKPKTIEVTAEMLRSLEELKKALASLPAGELRARAEAALAYLGRTLNPQAGQEKGKCPVNTTVIHT